ncbi:hypothetical protein AXE65_01485 [Ventosimonas gracilis]|uniref:Transcriptional regulator MraZ n=1 Tax=Ventosimonas gracilis TaxID=1680762 RepID=A0A139SV72_9GAMM|nr:division/cell wall cluster transcriptional repressor MraZ [Ventosimonas gracilis]KXU38414.1 hypothetical protein AXE65_01485 [Ventosimonas gracilis]
MLRGQFEVTIDDKGRLVMPSRCLPAFALKHDEQAAKALQETDQETEELSEAKGEEGKDLKGRLVIAPDVNSSKRLLVYPLDKWEAVERDWEERAGQDEDSEYIETLLGLVTVVDLDAKGRFALPGYLLECIGLKLKELSKNKFCLIGKKNKLELWQKELWDEEYQRANAALKEKQELARKVKEVEQAKERARNQAAFDAVEEAMKELMEEAKAGKEAMKNEIKQALLSGVAGQKNKSWDELVKGLHSFKM